MNTWKTSAVLWLTLLTSAVAGVERPNVVIILADDMGFGELQCLNPDRGKIPTPQLDRIAAGGMVFTDGHSGSAVCTPTRYGLMTGRYAWRTRLQKGVLTGGESLLSEDRLTLAKMLKQNGYHTAMFGKWHLGMLFDGKHVSGKLKVGMQVTHGPVDRGGFDHFAGFHHARQMNVWIENDRVTESLQPVDMLPKLTQSAVDYIHSRKGKQQPFFLYVPWNSPHSPVVPTEDWQGKSGLNAHADFVMQTDDSYGRIVRALRETGLIGNTLILCSADNGTSGPTSKMAQLNRMGHYPSANLRGSKADLWDGGHRVPFLVSWKGVVQAGSTCDQLVGLSDVMATVADILKTDLPDDQAVDSISFYPLLQGRPQHARQDIIHHSISGKFAIRSGDWKLMFAPGSGGWSSPKDTKALADGLPAIQLYDMRKDLGERRNLAEEHPEKVAELKQLLKQQVANGRSTPGPKQTNDAAIDFEKKTSAKPDKKPRTSGKKQRVSK